MSIRPMTSEEVQYLERMQADWRAARQFTYIAVGLVGLPVGFLLMALISRHGFGQDPLAMGLAAIILLGLMAGVLLFSGQSKPLLRFGLREARLLSALEDDLRLKEVAVEPLSITAKETQVPKRLGRPDPESPPSRRYILLAGGRRFEVTGLRWMNVAPGSVCMFEYAPLSGILLVLDDRRERLPLPGKPSPAPLDEGV